MLLAAPEGCRLMGTFRLCLIGASQQLLVDLAAANIEELVHDATASRFLAGRISQPDGHGCLLGVMIQTNRIQAAFEVS